MLKPPRFIVLEGIDGSGTTTVAALVADQLRHRGADVILTREPSQGPCGQLARKCLRTEARETIDPRCLGLLFAADRLEHLARQIEPALAAGQTVICDRYVVSSVVYQSLECDEDWICAINRHARWPDMTFVLSVPAEIAAARRIARDTALGSPEERFDDLEVQKQLAAAYKSFLAQENTRSSALWPSERLNAHAVLPVGTPFWGPGRGVVEVDATLSAEDVCSSIIEAIEAGTARG